VIDLGPGGGVNGGRIIAEGPPERIAEVSISATGQYLKPMLERASVKPVIVDVKPRKAKRPRKVTADEPDLIAAK
jgi:excinuclease ABC subunit A